MKKKILYLHGLESGQGGPKVDFLANKGFVHAPEMDYTRNDIFDFLIKTVNEFKPDVIVGSSMGGYSAFVLGGLYQIPVVAFNPALHSRTIEPNFPDFVKKHIPQELEVVLGNQDTVIDPSKTLNYLKDHIMDKCVSYKVHYVKTMGHRVPIEEFIDMYNKIIK
jgi:hypoxanthine phosphoribosyltransferase